MTLISDSMEYTLAKLQPRARTEGARTVISLRLLSFQSLILAMQFAFDLLKKIAPRHEFIDAKKGVVMKVERLTGLEKGMLLHLIFDRKIESKLLCELQIPS